MVQNGIFSPTSGFYDTNLIPCLPETTFCIIVEKKKSSQSLPEESLNINFFDENMNWMSGKIGYTRTATALTPEESLYGFGGWVYRFVSPANDRIKYWSTYYSANRWSSFGLFCYYDTTDGNRKFKGKMPISGVYYDELIPMSKIDGITDAVDKVEADTVMPVKEQSLYADWADFSTGYLNTSGSVAEYANAYVSDFVTVTPGSVVEYMLRVIGNSMLGVAWYDANQKFIAGIKHTGDAGTWQTEQGSVALPNNARYIRFGGRKYDGIAEKSQFVIYYHNVKIKDYIQNATASNPWEGKSWIAFGTSITDTFNSLGEGGKPTGKYVPYLKDMSGMTVNNRGIAGGSIGVVSGVLSGNIMTAIKSESNLPLIQNADLITIEGFVNDFVGNLPIGAISDTENSTLMGALYEAVTYLYEQNKNATIVLLTESTGQYIDSSHWFPVTRPNALGKYQYEYNDAIITMAKYLGCHVINCGQKSQINQWHPEYLEDWIHHSELGGKQYASTIWDELKNIHCNSDVSVN